MGSLPYLLYGICVCILSKQAYIFYGTCVSGRTRIDAGPPFDGLRNQMKSADQCIIVTGRKHEVPVGYHLPSCTTTCLLFF